MNLQTSVIESNASELVSNVSDSIENDMWQALEMDELKEEMTSKAFGNQNQILMGTGHTDNACYQCSNSATTHGCGTCG